MSRRPRPGGEVGDAGDPADVVRLARGADPLVGATRPAPGHEEELVDAARALPAGSARAALLDEAEQPAHRRRRFTAGYRPPGY